MASHHSPFGSATNDDRPPKESDLDLVVSFRRDVGGSIADRYLGLAEALEELFATRVDLIAFCSIRNPYLRHSIEATRTSLCLA
jgi:hypothetical protein